ncbi:MAG: peptidase inhibitor family I36 protein [Deinococcus sp.]|uniref:peptidase inhibitor family I36 protein n=1 Tax=Deinococcus sp. TaxID=47478 RepID=UPI0026DB9A92|nr:peptidase inhibitor family I36 protein [Deinococcus sp.]MDO4246031.1 peptidase inhibitor family I36 protein [Deinococcus sp.]
MFRKLLLFALFPLGLVACGQPQTPVGSRCAAGGFCLFEHRDFAGRQLTAVGNSGMLAQDDWDVLSSAINNTDQTLCLYDLGLDWKLYLLVDVAPKDKIDYVGDGDNDKINAWQLTSGTCETVRPR